MKEIIKKAAALSYKPGDDVPRITALGKGEVAQRIIETAKKSDIPIYENKEAVDTLMGMELGERIPPELYKVVAEILIFVSNIDKLKGETNGK